MSVNVTVLTDGNGVQREYREVNRKANVGELVKIVSCRMLHGLPIGSITVLDKDGVADGWFLEGSDGSDRDYVVLEPTGIVIIDGVRYREERRKAAVGERVLIVNPIATNGIYDKGDVLTIERYGLIGLPIADVGKTVLKEEYVVLTPIDEPKAETSTPAVYNVTVNVTVNGTVEDVVRTVGDAVKVEISKIAFTPPKPKSAQELRDEIVERAKADVEKLSRTHKSSVGGGASFWPRECAAIGFEPIHYVEFVVNREKRTVVALIKSLQTHKVHYRGAAKCAPGDVFNSHIGRAIALRRALELPVPDEYLNAPQPTEVRVGDVVETYLSSGGHHATFKVTGFYNGDKKKLTGFAGHSGYTSFSPEFGDKVIDDSREEVSA
ncbi:hypothetical protein [Brevibacillus agri]|uniref:hypothetical protein n=1 Tax=Brevibacillus agri TaxID=51101 RepID=UPI001EE612E8|nr:hypothetical protein [Brevibacillus agri]MCG5252598.1 hypothetical protein [Brevibacillus agri]